MPATEPSAATGRLFSNAMAATANVAVGSLLVFLLYWVLLQHLGSETLGAWSLLISSVSAARLSELGMAGAATRFIAVARARGELEHAASVAETITTTLLLLGMLGALLAHLLLPLLLARFLHGAQLEAALQALPWALAAFAIGLAGNVVQSALDGCQRVDLRVWVSLAGQLALLAAATLLATPFGLKGVAIAQILQSVVVLVGGWTLLRSQLSGLPLLPRRWSYATFRRILGYSALFQFNNLLLLLLDPLVKFMLARFGGLSATAYFEMANQLVQRLRQLPVAVAQVLVPAMTQAEVEGSGRVRELYLRGYRTIFAAAVPIFCLATMLVPAISSIWIGHEEVLFTGMMWICIAGWAPSTVGTPAYYGNVGTGALASNAVGHMLTNLIAFLLGWLGGREWGAFGVVTGYSIGIVAGGLFVQVDFMRRLGLGMNTLVPVESRWLLVLSLLAIVPGLAADAAIARSGWLAEPGPVGHVLRFGVPMLVFLLVTGASLWFHPVGRSVAGRMLHSIRRQPDSS
jgi:O-antigen/teichoic acid export membrane protein